MSIVGQIYNWPCVYKNSEKKTVDLGMVSAGEGGGC